MVIKFTMCKWFQLTRLRFLFTAKRKEPDEVTLKVLYVESMEKVLVFSKFFQFISLHDTSKIVGLP